MVMTVGEPQAGQRVAIPGRSCCANAMTIRRASPNSAVGLLSRDHIPLGGPSSSPIPNLSVRRFNCQTPFGSPLPSNRTPGVLRSYLSGASLSVRQAKRLRRCVFAQWITGTGKALPVVVEGGTDDDGAVGQRQPQRD